MSDIYINKIETYCLLYNNADEQKQLMIMNYITSLIFNTVIDQLFNVVSNNPRWLLDLIAEMHRQEHISWTVSDVVNYEGKEQSLLNYTFNGSAKNLGTVEQNGNGV